MAVGAGVALPEPGVGVAAGVGVAEPVSAGVGVASGVSVGMIDGSALGLVLALGCGLEPGWDGVVWLQAARLRHRVRLRGKARRRFAAVRKLDWR